MTGESSYFSAGIFQLTLMFGVGLLTGSYVKINRRKMIRLSLKLLGKDFASKSDKPDGAPKKYDGLDSESEEEDFEIIDNLDKEPCKMVLVARSDLKMGKGKLAAQCCHACLGAFRRTDVDVLKQWFRLGQTKVVVKVNSQEELRSIASNASSKKIPFYVVADAGRTQIAPGSETVCAVGPAPVSLIQEVTGHLKLM